MRRARLIFLVLSFNFFVGRLTAQQRVTVDASVARLQQTGIPISNALTGGVTYDAIGDRGWIRTSALVAAAGSNRATGQALVLGSLVGPSVNGARWEVAASVSGFAETNDVPSTSADVYAGGRLERGPGGFAVGVGVGAVALHDLRSSVLRAQGDAWWRAGNNQVGMSLSAVDVPSAQDRMAFHQSSDVLSPQRSVSYFDAALTARHDDAVVSLSVAGAVRATNGTGLGGWGSMEAAFWLTNRSAFVIGGGRFLDDVMRGVPRTTFASVGVRLTSEAHVVASEARSPVVVTVLPSGARRIEIRDVAAARLEIMGDFTDWKPVPLERAAKIWRVDLSITPGLHRIAMRADGGEWTAPPGLPHADDGLGGTVGLITVP